MSQSLTRRVCPLVPVVALALTCVAADAAKAAPAGFATRAHRPTGLQISVPAPYRMGFRKGVYVLTAPGRTLTFSRAVTTVGADAYVSALLGQIGGTVRFRGGGPAEAAAIVDLAGRKEALVVERRGRALIVTTSSSRVSDPLRLEVVRSIGRSARGGIALQATQRGVGQPVKPIALTPYRAPDGGSSALVPAGPGWTFDGGNGAVQGSSSRGAFLFGYSTNIVVPGAAPGPVPAGFTVAPYMNASTTMVNLVPKIFPGVTNVQIREILRDAALPSFTSSALFRVDYRLNGRPWTGAVLIGTDDPSKYGNLVWNLYYSGVGVPVGGDPAVGVGLLRSWRSWDASGAIAARTRAQLQLINETNQVWQQVAEFRSVTADRQARDVGCLLSGYYAVEDNSRRYNLPPLPCGQIYVEK